MPWNNIHTRVPRSAVRQNLLYSIESLARRVSQVEAAQNGKVSKQASAFFEETYRDLDQFRKMVEKDLKLRQVYIYQKLFDVSRDLFKYAPPSDIEYQFLFIQRSLANELDVMSETDRESFDVLQKEVLRLQKEDIDERLSVQGLGVISYFTKIIQDKQILTIWNSEKLVTSST